MVNKGVLVSIHVKHLQNKRDKHTHPQDPGKALKTEECSQLRESSFTPSVSKFSCGVEIFLKRWDLNFKLLLLKGDSHCLEQDGFDGSLGINTPSNVGDFQLPQV